MPGSPDLSQLGSLVAEGGKGGLPYVYIHTNADSAHYFPCQGQASNSDYR